MEEQVIVMPTVALRGMTILPGMVQHFDVSRPKSIAAVEKAMLGDQKLFFSQPEASGDTGSGTFGSVSDRYRFCSKTAGKASL